MNCRTAKRERKEVRKQINIFLEKIWKLSFKDRLQIAWRMLKGS